MVQLLVVGVTHRPVQAQNHNQSVDCCWSLTTGISVVWAAAIYNEQPATWFV